MNPKNRSKLNRITFGVDDVLHEKIRNAAEKEGKSIAAWCAEVIAKSVRAKTPKIRMGRPKKPKQD